jgi:hypothetical protein
MFSNVAFPWTLAWASEVSPPFGLSNRMRVATTSTSATSIGSIRVGSLAIATPVPPVRAAMSNVVRPTGW